jgi:hypothetical protein
LIIRAVIKSRFVRGDSKEPKKFISLFSKSGKNKDTTEAEVPKVDGPEPTGEVADAQVQTSLEAVPEEVTA